MRLAQLSVSMCYSKSLHTQYPLTPTQTKMELQKPNIVSAFMSWLQYEAHLSNDENIWIVNLHETNTIKIMHTDVFTAVLHGMTCFTDEELKFEAIRQRLEEWCDDTSDKQTLNNISIHVREWGPLVIDDIQTGSCIALLQTLDVYVHDMAEVILEYPDEYVEIYGDKYIKAVQYQSIIKMPSYAGIAA